MTEFLWLLVNCKALSSCAGVEGPCLLIMFENLLEKVELWQ